jgi:glutathione S-transferase
MIELFLAERCPFCVKVRLFMEQKGISYLLKPVVLGHGTSPVKEELRKLGGKVQVPFLVDPEKGIQMYESDDIIAYVEENYVQS